MHPNFVKTFLRSIYVDDVAYGADNDDMAYDLYLQSKRILGLISENLLRTLLLWHNG